MAFIKKSPNTLQFRTLKTGRNFSFRHGNDEKEDRKRQDVSCPLRRCFLCKHHLVTLSSSGCALRNARGRHKELQDELQKTKDELTWVLQGPQELWNGKVTLDVEIPTYKTLLEGEQSRWVPPQASVGSTWPWCSSKESRRVESARNAHSIMDNLVTSFSSRICLGSPVGVGKIKVFSFPYKIKPRHCGLEGEEKKEQEEKGL